MRILHTSDWHLGQKLIAQNRDAEQAWALDWLLDTIRSEQVDVLIVAGDIFDVSNPPIAAEEIYYRFLARLRDTGCRQVVIIGGNHDSPAQLNAPRGLLKALEVYVVGAATEEIGEELIPLKNTAGEIELVVAAIPFLRDRDFKFTTAGESVDDRIRRIQAGIVEHYTALAAIMEERYPGKRSIATGHLYAKGASASEEQHNIYIGNLENIAAEQFPAQFDYIALGHIHRAQKVGKQDRIRYAGSLIPLSFSEIEDKKRVLFFEITPEKGLGKVREINVPIFRKLLRVKGKLSEVEAKLQAAHQPDDPLPAWIEVVVTDENMPPNLHQYLRDQVKDLHLDLLKIRHERANIPLESLSEQEDLSVLTPAEVFAQRCVSKGISPEATQQLQQTFAELEAWAIEQAERL